MRILMRVSHRSPSAASSRHCYFLFETLVSPIYLSNNNLDGFHKLVYAPHWTPAPEAAQAQLITIAGARKRLMKSRETIRVGAGAGTSDDRMVPALELAERGDIDYLVFECLAERTVSRENLARSKDPQLGYSPSLHARLRMVLPTCIRKGIRIVSNMGAANPLGGARGARTAERIGGPHIADDPDAFSYACRQHHA